MLAMPFLYFAFAELSLYAHSTYDEGVPVHAWLQVNLDLEVTLSSAEESAWDGLEYCAE